ncbi:MAG: hypothetical protein KC478_15335 [Bacteriovoracaceae bacterium]|nr:hypothetical protein [Bacteriovoracaceae bacterium]
MYGNGLTKQKNTLGQLVPYIVLIFMIIATIGVSYYVFKNNEIIFQISRELQKQGINNPNTLNEFINAWFVQRKR